MWTRIKRLLQSSYQSRLENFILKRYPKDCADVERLIAEFNRKVSQSWI